MRGRGMTKRWRDVLQIHPAAELFPLMTPDELHALGEDIKKNGLTSPIVLWRSHPQAPAQLLDGTVVFLGGDVRVAARAARHQEHAPAFAISSGVGAGDGGWEAARRPPR